MEIWINSIVNVRVLARISTKYFIYFLVSLKKNPHSSDVNYFLQPILDGEARVEGSYKQ